MADERVSHSGDAPEPRATILHDAECNAARRVGASPRIGASEAEWVNHFGVALSKSGSSLAPASSQIGLNNDKQFDEPQISSRSDGAELRVTVSEKSRYSAARQKITTKLLPGPLKGGFINIQRRVALLIALLLLAAVAGAFWRMGIFTLTSYIPFSVRP